MSNESNTPITGGRYHTLADGKVVPLPEQETDELCAVHGSAPTESVEPQTAKTAPAKGKTSHKHSA